MRDIVSNPGKVTHLGLEMVAREALKNMGLGVPRY